MVDTRHTVHLLNKLIKFRVLTRKTAERYCDQILEIHNLIPNQRWDKFNLLADFDDKRNFKGKWDYSRFCLYKDDLIGICFSFEESYGLYIHRLAVDKLFQSNKIATHLIKESVKSYVKKRGKSSLIRVQTPKDSDKKNDLYPFYNKLGFEKSSYKTYENRCDYVLEAKSEAVLNYCAKRLI